MKKSPIVLSSLMLMTLAGCATFDDQTGRVPTAVSNIPFAYHPPVQQGNVVTQEMVEKLKIGMDRNQVLFIMGTPTIRDVFRDNRWDYVYNRYHDNDLVEQYKYTLFFEGDRLVGMEGDFTQGLATNAPAGIATPPVVMEEAEQ